MLRWHRRWASSLWTASAPADTAGPLELYRVDLDASPDAPAWACWLAVRVDCGPWRPVGGGYGSADEAKAACAVDYAERGR